MSENTSPATQLDLTRAVENALEIILKNTDTFEYSTQEKNGQKIYFDFNEKARHALDSAEKMFPDLKSFKQEFFNALLQGARAHHAIVATQRPTTPNLANITPTIIIPPTPSNG